LVSSTTETTGIFSATCQHPSLTRAGISFESLTAEATRIILSDSMNALKPYSSIGKQLDVINCRKNRNTLTQWTLQRPTGTGRQKLNVTKKWIRHNTHVSAKL
jgi:hypothetical protein